MFAHYSLMHLIIDTNLCLSSHEVCDNIIMPDIHQYYSSQINNYVNIVSTNVVNHHCMSNNTNINQPGHVIIFCCIATVLCLI